MCIIKYLHPKPVNMFARFSVITLKKIHKYKQINLVFKILLKNIRYFMDYFISLLPITNQPFLFIIFRTTLNFKILAKIFIFKFLKIFKYSLSFHYIILKFA